MDELDPNKVAAELIQASMERALALGSDTLRSARDRIRLRLENTYAKYIQRLLERHSKAKSFFVRTEPIPLYDFFVPLDLRTQKRLLASPSVSDLAKVSTCSILTGTGGSGKSMIMRHLLISALTSRAKTPIFLELRQLDWTSGELTNALLTSLQTNGLDLDADYFGLAIRAGHFLILLDGFDELDRRVRPKASKAIQALAEQYPHNWLVLTSRPDPELEGWAAFTLFRVEPLDITKAVALVERLNFDVDIKRRFLRDLRDDLFERHKSFLSNPLLLSIMLLTYHDTAHIPSKLSIFYNQAYESLFQKHDALKGGYQRQRRTLLDIQDFARVFSAFCVRTYDKRLFRFSESTALDVLDRCKSQTQLDFEPSAYLDDARQAVCLLVDEGVDIAFAHRSFQEYFTARFVAESPPQIKAQLIERFSGSMGADAVIPLLHEIDPFAVEQHYILPALLRLRQGIKLKRAVERTHFVRFVRMLFNSFELQNDPKRGMSATIKNVNLFHAVRFVHSRYGPAPSPTTELLRARQEAVASAFESEFDRQRLPTTKLTTRSPFLQALMDAPGLWGMQYLRELIAIETTIRRRHSETEASLDAILK